MPDAFYLKGLEFLEAKLLLLVASAACCYRCSTTLRVGEDRDGDSSGWARLSFIVNSPVNCYCCCLCSN